MAAEKLFGLQKIDLGGWQRGQEQRRDPYVENLKAGFRVYYHYPDVRGFGNLCYVVCKDDFCIGFRAPDNNEFRHGKESPYEKPEVIIDTIGGDFFTANVITTGHEKIASATHFKSEEQQIEFINALKAASPLIPIYGQFRIHWANGFGYSPRFTDAVATKLNSNGYIKNANTGRTASMD